MKMASERGMRRIEAPISAAIDQPVAGDGVGKHVAVADVFEIVDERVVALISAGRQNDRPMGARMARSAPSIARRRR